jgi:hypothetical protein
MKVQAVLHANETENDVAELRERVVALTERIVALAEAANIIAEVAAPFRPLSGHDGPSFFAADGFKALDRAAARLEAARIAAVSEFVEARRQLDGEEISHH